MSHAIVGLDSDRAVEPVAMSSREPAPPLPQGNITAEAVPEAARPQPVPLVRILMPVVMIAAMVGLVALILLSGAKDGRQVSPMMLLFPVMMLMSVFMMFSPQGGTNDPDETRRTYLRHLKALREKAEDNGAKQRAHETHRHPGPDELAAIIGAPRMWERAAGDPDALEARVGLGRARLCTPITVPDAGASEDLDPVCAVSLRHTLQAVETLPDMPVVIQLQAFPFVGVAGPQARAFVRAVILQLVSFHGPEAVSVSALGVGARWDWLKWLPHARSPRQAHFRLLIVDSVPTTGVEEFFTAGYTTIIEVGSQRTTALGQRAEQEGLSLLVDAEGDLRVVTAAGDERLGVADTVTADYATLCARRMASYHRPAGTVAAERTFDGELLPMVGMEDAADLHRAGGLWPGQGRTGASRLKVPIGITPEGQAVSIDLKESAEGGMGPHGLCIGATGSGNPECGFGLQ